MFVNNDYILHSPTSMCNILIYLLLIFTLLYEVHTIDCENSRYEVHQLHENNECYTPVTDTEESSSCTYTCSEKPKVTATTVDNDKGTVIVRFPLPPSKCGHTLYTVDLFVNEQVQEESDCNENASKGLKHSTKDYKINRCDDGNCVGKPCDEFGEVVFGNVFTGCYKVVVHIRVNISSRAGLYSCPLFISTNYTKLRVADIAPGLSVSYNQQESLTDVIIGPKTTFESMTVTIADELWSLEEGSCDREGRAHSCCLVDKNEPLCMARSKLFKEPSCNLAKLHDEIHCKFYNTSPGNYCLRIKFTDDRCIEGTMWTANTTACRWSHVFKIEDLPPNKPVISMPVASTLTAFLVLLGIALGGVVVFLLFWRRVPTNSNWSADSSEEVGRPMMEGLKVLLLYPRDCPEFMTTMDSFRKLLETYNVEVYDCHTNDEVLNGPLYWLQNVMAYPKLCTVIVSSHCAYLQQQAIRMGHMTNAENVYKDPTFIDSVFVYGLKIIMEDISTDTYLKNFVIGFSGFSSDEKMLTMPTSFRRYCIPEHLPKLLVDMNLELALENVESINSNEYKELRNNLDSLVDYVKLKPQYLEDILNLV